MKGLGFAIAILAGTLFGVGGTFAQFLFQQRGVDVGWLVTMRLMFGGVALLAISAAIMARNVLAVWRQDGVTLMLFGLIGMMPVQYTYMAAIRDSNNCDGDGASVYVARYSGSMVDGAPPLPAHIRELAAIALAALGTFFLATHGRIGALSISPIALFWGLASAAGGGFQFVAAG